MEKELKYKIQVRRRPVKMSLRRILNTLNNFATLRVTQG